MEEERPFFVKIGKDGLIAALQKLDRQLRNVRRHPKRVGYWRRFDADGVCRLGGRIFCLRR